MNMVFFIPLFALINIRNDKLSLNIYFDKSENSVYTFIHIKQCPVNYQFKIN